MYLYEGHMDGLYLTNNRLSPDELFCETCGDRDIEIGYFENATEVLVYMADEINIDGNGYWDIDHVLEALSEFDFCPNKEEAIEIIRKNKKKEI